ncbi:sugar phosphate isomerase/epimerase [Sphingobacterium hotanense]|uniref:Sugar phosphate isomerase/epimerase n=1 Tax=Sphingobacterium hotanense TaxID=649196 RepID=A0ABT7NJT1_9SPHI|nr:sugar phosphate isomerase/epimerase [Sphingobacterium hotanense]MDM1047469.1 sugar phosphate isomerase/epimerase [Sphingobacterium hotanense]
MVDIQFFYPRWGAEHTAWTAFLDRVKDAGYQGIEWYPYGEKNKNDYQQMLQSLQDRQLRYSIVFAVFGGAKDFAHYLELLEEQLTELANLGEYGLAPEFISAQAGREYYTSEQILACLAVCSKVEQQTGISIYQETHRNKWTYGIHRIPAIKEQFPGLKLTLDISHWYCVSESYLEDQQDLLTSLLSDVCHVHTRVGHTQGSQISDVSNPLFEDIVKTHLTVWQQYISKQIQLGRKKLTFTTEFGPPPYLITSGDSVKDYEEQWRQNLWIKKYLMDHLKTI